VDGIPVTSPARTLLDTAEVVPPRVMVRMLEQAERLGLFDLGAIERLVDRSHGRRGLKPLAAAMVQSKVSRRGSTRTGSGTYSTSARQRKSRG
jgi:hypothetical protein